MMELAIKAKQMPVSSVAIVPPLIYPGDPDFAKVAQDGGDQDRQGRGGGRDSAPSPQPDAGAERRPASKPKKKPKADSPRPAQTNNLSKVCAA